MLNSYVFIAIFVIFLSVRASLNGSDDLPCMISGVPRGSRNAYLTPVPIGVWTIQASPMALHAACPPFGFGRCDRRLNLLVRVPWPFRHPLLPVNICQHLFVLSHRGRARPTGLSAVQELEFLGRRVKRLARRLTPPRSAGIARADQRQIRTEPHQLLTPADASSPNAVAIAT
jgi:hypothetical protein